ncbi:MAG: hypothetical protein NW217_00655 [Hyphomicrobiaceae bacterium]|nr:hypothetical protein [Hyphomicrobiaceae bacterium]
MTTAAPADSMAATGSADHARPLEIYRPGAIRTITFSFVFLLLLPFFVSLGPMLYARLSQGHATGTPGLIVTAVAFSLLMLLILVELVVSIRSRVALGQTRVRLTLPQYRSLLPVFGYHTRDIAYDEIAAIEMRREVYGGFIAPVILKGARMRLKDGDTIQLGYVSEANVDPSLPYSEIAEKIAARAGVEIIDQGDVRRSLVRKMMGVSAAEAHLKPIDPATITAINRRHDMFMLALVGGLVVLVAFGILTDRESDIGHARTLATSSSGKPEAAATKAAPASPAPAASPQTQKPPLKPSPPQ